MDATQQSVEAVLQQHHDLLQAHRRFIEALKARSKGVEGVGEVLEVCASQVDSMVEDFEQCKSKFTQASSASTPVKDPPGKLQPQPTKAVPVASNGKHATIDNSGLFMTDTKPSPVEEVLRSSSGKETSMPSRAKRKFVDDENSAALKESNGPRLLKKAKQSGVLSRDGSHEGRQNSGRSKKAEPDQYESDNDSFVREVHERLVFEEAQKRKKAIKKRKRDSGGSDAPQGQSTEPRDIDKASKPNRKKAKTRGKSVASDGTSSVPLTPLKQSRQPTPQPDRHKKRPSPASEYVNNILHRAKRKKT